MTWDKLHVSMKLIFMTSQYLVILEHVPLDKSWLKDKERLKEHRRRCKNNQAETDYVQCKDEAILNVTRSWQPAIWLYISLGIGLGLP